MKFSDTLNVSNETKYNTRKLIKQKKSGFINTILNEKIGKPKYAL